MRRRIRNDLARERGAAPQVIRSREEAVRRFATFTTDLYELADWLQACHVESVAMESTGVYWIALYEILEERG